MRCSYSEGGLYLIVVLLYKGCDCDRSVLFFLEPAVGTPAGIAGLGTHLCAPEINPS